MPEHELPSSAVPSEDWNLRPGLRVWVGGNNAILRRSIARFLTGVLRPSTGPLDAAIITAHSPDEARYFLSKLRSRLTPDGVAWVIEGTTPTSPSSNAIPDPIVSAIGFAHFATVTLEATLLAHGYRRSL